MGIAENFNKRKAQMDPEEEIMLGWMGDYDVGVESFDEVREQFGLTPWAMYGIAVNLGLDQGQFFQKLQEKYRGDEAAAKETYDRLKGIHDQNVEEYNQQMFGLPINKWITELFGIDEETFQQWNAYSME